MRIGFDAKRAFHNHTGLGNYSRTLINALANYYPENKYKLFTPKPSRWYTFHQQNISEIGPNGFLAKTFSSLWRSKWMTKDIQKHADVYHGLSHELPLGIENFKGKKVVTIHDLIFEHYPEQYRKMDVQIYRKKLKYACEKADKIIVISESTKQDLVNYYKVSDKKIDVCYQSCEERFYTRLNIEQKEKLRSKYQLPPIYFLSVGSIIERKNLLRLVEAYALLNQKDIPLVVVGKGGDYKQKVIQFLIEKKIQNQIIFLEDNFNGNDIYNDLPGIYQMAHTLVYPSIMEGFGLPVLEAMTSGAPVITSNISSMAEIGNHASLQVNPLSVDSIHEALQISLHNNQERSRLIEQGLATANQMNNKNYATQLMKIYQNLF